MPGLLNVWITGLKMPKKIYGVVSKEFNDVVCIGGVIDFIIHCLDDVNGNHERWRFKSNPLLFRATECCINIYVRFFGVGLTVHRQSV